MSTHRRASSNKRWRAHFHATWRTLCAAHGNVELTPQLVQLARTQRTEGHGPEATAAGLYWGTRHAQLDQQGGL